MDSNAVFAISLLIVGLAILVAEIFIPSGGLLGVITFLSLVVSIIFAYRAWGTSHPNIFWLYCVMLLLLVPTIVGYGFYLLPSTSMGKRVLLEAPTPQDVTPYSKESERLTRLVGQFGSTLTMLNPGGLVTVSGQRLHALSDGLLVEQGQPVEVIAVQGTNVIVRPGIPPAEEPDEWNKPTTKFPSPLDFDFPTAS